MAAPTDTPLQRRIVSEMAKYPRDLLHMFQKRRRAIAEIAHQTAISHRYVRRILLSPRPKGKMPCEAWETVLNAAKSYPADLFKPSAGRERRLAVLAIAKASGATTQYVQMIIQREADIQFGNELRAREAHEPVKGPVVQTLDVELIAQQFHDWADTFGRFVSLATALIQLARRRGDAYAAAFLKDIQEVADRAQIRAFKDPSSMREATFVYRGPSIAYHPAAAIEERQD